LQRIDPDWVSDVLELDWAEIAHLQIEPSLDLAIGVLGEADVAWLGDPLETGGDVDAVAHEVAVALLDHVADMDTDSKLDALLGRHAHVAVDESGLYFDRAAHGVDHAAELDDRGVAGALDDAAVMGGDGGVDQIASKAPQTREGSVLVSAGESAVADHIGDQDRSNLADLGHGAPSRVKQNTTGEARAARLPIESDWTEGSQARANGRMADSLRLDLVGTPQGRYLRSSDGWSRRKD
jgi:hypothetical protein